MDNAGRQISANHVNTPNTVHCVGLRHQLQRGVKITQLPERHLESCPLGFKTQDFLHVCYISYGDMEAGTP